MPASDWTILMRELEECADEDQAAILAWYFKTSRLRFLGLRLPDIYRVIRPHIKGATAEQLVEMMTGLWAQPYYEAKRAAIDIMQTYAKRESIDTALLLISDWIDDIDTWALTDPLCITALGTLMRRDLSVEKHIAQWRSSDNFWRRRATVLPYLHLALKQFYREDYGPRILDGLRPHLADKEFFVAKAVGWVLRELSKREPELVCNFIRQNQSVMTALAIREGSKKISADCK